MAKGMIRGGERQEGGVVDKTGTMEKMSRNKIRSRRLEGKHPVQTGKGKIRLLCRKGPEAILTKLSLTEVWGTEIRTPESISTQGFGVKAHQEPLRNHQCYDEGETKSRNVGGSNRRNGRISSNFLASGTKKRGSRCLKWTGHTRKTNPNNIN